LKGPSPKIAEDFGSGSKHEFVNALTIAKSEAEEVKTPLYRGFDIGYFRKQLFANCMLNPTNSLKK
jgi:four helix bundle protein